MSEPANQQTNSRPPLTGLVVILAIFLVVSVLHSLIVPLTQGEDELAHYRYLAFIAQTGRLPRNEAEREQAWYRADWPPLYHLLVGGVVSPLDTTRPHLKDVGELPQRRLVGEIFYPRLIIYTEDANWPWQDGILAWHIGRFISIFFAGAALIFTWLTALELGRGIRLPLSPPAFATAVTALLAFTPRFLFTSAMLGDDSLFILLSSMFIWLLLRALRGDDRWRLYANMGLLLGLSIATKYSTGLFPLIIIPLVWRRARQTGWGWPVAVGRVAVSWLFTVIGAGWWFGWTAYYFNTIKEDGLIYGLLHPWLASGPDVSMRRIFDFFGGGVFTGLERPDAIEAGTFWNWTVYLFQTFWGVPILERDPFFPWAYLFMAMLCLAGLVGLWRVWRTADSQTRVALSMLTLPVALLFPFPILRFFLTRNVLETGQGRHILYPAAQAIPILLMMGWLHVIYYVQQKLKSFSLSRNLQFVILISLLLWSLFQLGIMARTYPDPLPVQSTTFNPASIPQPLTRNFGDDIQLLGYDFQPDPEQAIIHLTLYWRALNQVDQNYRTRVQLVDPDGQTHFTWLSHPVNGLYPTRTWDQGDVIRDELPLPLAAVSPKPYKIQIDWLPEAEDIPLTAEPLTIIQFSLPARQPIAGASMLDGVDYRLWLDVTRPARARQTIPLSFENQRSEIENLQWALIGPDDVPRPPAAVSEATAIFIVGPDWPGGDYRLQLVHNGQTTETGSQFAVAAEPRLFSLPQPIEGYTPVEATFAVATGQPQVKLMGYALPARRVQPGGSLPLTLYWQSMAPVLGDTVTFAVLLNADQQPFGSVDRYPAGYYSPMLWANGEIVPDDFSLGVRPDAPPGVYTVHIGQYRLENNQPESLPLLHQNQLTDQTAVGIGPVKVGGPPPDVVTQNPQPPITMNQPFGNQITLLGYGLNESPIGKSPQPPRSPAPLRFRFYWRADRIPAADYTVFLHLRNKANENVAQKDSPPAAGRYPTSLWDSGEIIVDDLILPVADVPPGEYTPVVGLYNFVDGVRLPVPGIPANEIALPPVQIGE